MAASVRNCCSCRVVQCLCFSVNAGVLTLAALNFVNACLAFAGEAALVFDLGGAVVTSISGTFLPPGTKLEGNTVHGGLIVVGVYSLLSSLVGFWAVCRRSLRAASLFFLSVVLSTFLACAVLVITWMTGACESRVPSATYALLTPEPPRRRQLACLTLTHHLSSPPPAASTLQTASESSSPTCPGWSCSSTCASW